MRPVAVAAGKRVEAQWAGLTSPEEVESLRQSLQAMLDTLKRDPDTDDAPEQG